MHKVLIDRGVWVRAIQLAPATLIEIEKSSLAVPLSPILEFWDHRDHPMNSSAVGSENRFVLSVTGECLRQMS